MFIEKEDYLSVVSDKSLTAIMEAATNIEQTQEEAIEEMSGYLRPAYDCDTIFSQTGTDRSRQLVMYACDISLYHAISAMPQRMGYEARKERYDRAIKWLEGVQAGKITPDLPLATDSSGETASASGIIAYGSGPDRHSW